MQRLQQISAEAHESAEDNIKEMNIYKFWFSSYLTVATHIIQNSLNELSTLVSGKAKCKQTKATT